MKKEAAESHLYQILTKSSQIKRRYVSVNISVVREHDHSLVGKLDLVDFLPLKPDTKTITLNAAYEKIQDAYFNGGKLVGELGVKLRNFNMT